MDTEKSGGGSPWSHFEVYPLVLDALGALGDGALSAASVMVRRVEVVIL